MKKIYIIDDDDIYQMILRRIISKINPVIKIESYGTGQLGLDALIETHISNQPFPDVIFLDINMPVLDGWQFLEGLASYFKPEMNIDLNIYMISTSIDEKDKTKALENYFIKDFLNKPVLVETLKIIINND